MGAGPSRNAPQVLNSMGSIRPSTSASPYRTGTHSKLTGYSASPMDRSLPCQKNTLQIRSHTWEIFTQNPPTMTTTRSPSCPCPTGFTMCSLGQPQDAVPYSCTPTDTSHGGSPPNCIDIGKPTLTLCPQKPRSNPLKLRYGAARRYKQGLRAGWR